MVSDAGRFGVTKVSSDAELISACRSGDPAAYGVLYERHLAAALRLARQLTRSPADADDVVAETFARVLGAMRRGFGPSEAFRPYLLTALRRVVIDLQRARPAEVPLDEAGQLAEPFIDPAVANLERSLLARAIRSLPERWLTVLWHTEVEQAKPAEVALLLGVTPNGVAALRYRAREGLRQAYLQMHLRERTRPECAPFAGKLAAHVRGGLSSRDAYRVSCHLTGCTACREAHAELAIMNSSLRGQLAPVILGGGAAAYLAGGAGAGRLAAAWSRGPLRRLPTHRPAPRSPAAHHGAAGRGSAPGRCARHLPLRPALHLTAGAAALTAVLVLAPAPSHQRLAAPPGGNPGSAGPPAQTTSPAAMVRRAPGQPVPETRPGRTLRSSGSAAPSPHRTPSGSPSPTGSPAPSPSPSPTPTPDPPPSTSGIAAALDLTIDVGGVLNLGVTVVVTVNVADPGTADTAAVAAKLTLPPGTVVLGIAAGSAGWTCSGGTAGPTDCTHAPIPAGGAAPVGFRLLVVSLTGCGQPVIATATSGALSATATSQRQVQCLI